MRRLTVIIGLLIAGSMLALGQSQTYTNPKVDYTLELPSPTWRVSVEPDRGAIYDARLNRLGPSLCLRSSWMWWRTAGCRLI